MLLARLAFSSSKQVQIKLFMFNMQSTHTRKPKNVIERKRKEKNSIIYEVISTIFCFTFYTERSNHFASKCLLSNS